MYRKTLSILLALVTVLACAAAAAPGAQALQSPSPITYGVTEEPYYGGSSVSGGTTVPDYIVSYQQIDEYQVNQIAQTMLYYPGRSGHSYDSYPRNNAFQYYYYSQLGYDIQRIYEAIQTAAYDPYSPELYVKASVLTMPGNPDFQNCFNLAYTALCYDHPELFWLIRGHNIIVNVYYNPNQSGPYFDFYVRLTNLDYSIEQEIIQFNQNAQAFLNLVNTGTSRGEIAKQIHDLLICNVTYDMQTCQNLAYQNNNLAHSAYGALVCNSAGLPFYAVCDGYSLAYEYLLQQVGIEATIIQGYSGSDYGSLSGHTWNAIRVDGAWQEVDVTWDDAGIIFATCSREDPAYYGLVREACSNYDYSEKITHYLYRLSTAAMSSFQPDDSYRYVTTDGRWISLRTACVHTRFTASDHYIEGTLMSYAPYCY